jgi:hypothetical protein
MALRAMGVVRVGETPLLVWLLRDRSNHPAAAFGCRFPSLSKEGNSIWRVSRQKLG